MPVLFVLILILSFKSLVKVFVNQLRVYSSLQVCKQSYISYVSPESNLWWDWSECTLLSFMLAFLSFAPFWRTQERLCMNRVRSSLRMRCMLLGYSFNPRLNGRVLGTVGSVTTIGLIKKMDVKNQFDEGKKNWLVQKSGLRRLHRPYAAADPDLQIRKGAGGDGRKKFFPPFGLKMRGGIGAPGPLPWIPHCYVTKAVSIKKKTNVGSARRVKWLIKPSFNYMFTCSLFSHPMLKCVEYKLFLYFLQSRDVSQFYDIKRSRDHSMALSECWDHLYQINSPFFFLFQIKLLLTQMQKQTNSSLM